MIGVIVRAEQARVAEEFFELFKTPWEFYRPGQRYEVVLDTVGRGTVSGATLRFVYGSRTTAWDEIHGIAPAAHDVAVLVAEGGERLPIYCGCVAVSIASASRKLEIDGLGDAAALVVHDDVATTVRVGYDLLREVEFLLTAGQPPRYALLPTLDRHIAFLRDCIVGAGLPLVEIPPVPAGYRFITCLTHDVDHGSVRAHKLDRTMFGFLYRAVIGSVSNWWRGRITTAMIRQNLGAAARVPLVQLGLAKDFWADFDRYLDVERGFGSTFFVIPERNNPGRSATGCAPRKRGSAYRLSDINRQMRAIQAADGEIAVHGIDAWRDVGRGKEECDAVTHATGIPPLGSRIHWLYWDEDAPRRLEQAGFIYDSTMGYNDTVGFRAGTTQVFKPLSATRLLELPLNIMDTALFYPAYLALTQDTAYGVVRPLIDEMDRFGGALTINWHDRSLAPERLWEPFYRGLLEMLKERNPWSPTARRAIAWFQRRRAATFEAVQSDADSVQVKVSDTARGDLPGLTLRLHVLGSAGRQQILDMPFHGKFEAKVDVMPARPAIPVGI
jgi:hypothetical protein